MNNFKSFFGAKVKELRTAKALTQEKLSEIIDISPRQLSKIESGLHFVKCSTLERLCKALDCDAKDLFDFRTQTNKSISNREYMSLLKKISLYYEDKFAIEFLKASLKALNSKKGLKELDLMVKAMKILRKID